MKIRNLEAYRVLHAQSKTTFQLPYPEPEILDERFYLFTLLATSGQKIPQYLDGITNFATDPYSQVFYELLQNASDEDASTLYIYFDDKQLLVANDGKKFDEDDLWGFLSQGASIKYDDERKQGRFGQGSKLLYALLADTDGQGKRSDKIKEKLLGLESLILFSWQSREQFDNMRDFAHDFQPVQETDSPILAKFLYSFLPVSPGTEKIVGAQAVNLFTNQEISDFQQFFQKVSKVGSSDFEPLSCAQMPQGSIIYLPLGEGVADKIRASFQHQLLGGLSTALRLFRSVNRIVLNKEVIYPADLSRLSPSGKADYAILYPNAVKNTATDKEINIYNFAPLSTTQYGLRLHLHHRNFDVPRDRQRIDWDAYNLNRLAEIDSYFFEQLENLKTNQDRFWGIYRAMLFSDFSPQLQIPGPIQAFKAKIFQFLGQNIPTALGYQSKEKVFLQGTALALPLHQIAENSYWIDSEDQATVDRIGALFGLATWSIREVILQGNNEKLSLWIQGLEDSSYGQLVSEIEDTFPEQEGLAQQFKVQLGKVAWLGDISGGWHRLEDYNNAEKAFFVIESRTARLVDIFDNLELNYSSLSLAQFPKLDAFAQLSLGGKALFEKLRGHIQREQLGKYDKWELLRIMRNLVSKQEIRKLKYFKNRKDQWVSLGQLVSAELEHTYVHIPPQFRLAESERNPQTLDNFLVHRSEVFQLLIHPYWEQWLPAPALRSLEVVAGFYNFIQSTFRGKMPADFRFVFSADGRFIKASEAVCLSYKQAANKAIQPLLDKFGTYSPAHPELREFFVGQNTIFRISQRLSELLPSEILLDYKEIALLLELFHSNELNLFDYAYIHQNGPNQYQLNKRQTTGGPPEQFRVSDINLKTFLQNRTDLFALLPVSLEAFVDSQKIPIKRENLQTVNQLIQHYGFQRDFVGAVIQLKNAASRDLYLGKMPARFPLVNDFQQIFSPKDFEYQLALLAATYIKDDPQKGNQLKAKLAIGKLSLADLQYSDEVTLINTKKQGIKRQYHYQLADLLPQHRDKSALLSKTRACFSKLPPEALNIFLAVRNIDAQTVYAEFARWVNPVAVRNPAQLSFFVLYSEIHDQHSPIQRAMLKELVERQATACLDRLYQDRIHFFARYFQFPDFQPAKKALSLPENQVYLTAKERLPEWIEDWAAGDEDKASFLKACGLVAEFEKTIHFRWRQAAKMGLKQSLALPEVADAYWRENTLDWISQQKLSWSISQAFIKELLNLIAQIPPSLDQHWALLYTEAKRVELRAIPADATLYYIENLSDFEALRQEAIPPIVVQRKLPLLYEGAVDEILKHFLQQRLKPIKVSSEVNKEKLRAASAEDEWSAAYYQNWKKLYPYQIYILAENIPYKFSLEGEQGLLECIKEMRYESLYIEGKQIYIAKDTVAKHSGSVEKTLRNLVDQQKFDINALLDLYESRIGVENPDRQSSEQVQMLELLQMHDVDPETLQWLLEESHQTIERKKDS